MAVFLSVVMVDFIIASLFPCRVLGTWRTRLGVPWKIGAELLRGRREGTA